MNVENRIGASREQVWAALNDPEILKASIPGCESFEETAENNFKARIIVKVGPVKTTFNFVITLSDINPPHGYTINGKGKGGAAGFANGGAVVSLKEDGDSTILAYRAQAHVGGKLAQMGSRLIDGTANKLAAEFFNNFSRILVSDAGADSKGESETKTETEAATRGRPRIPIGLWVIALAAMLLVVYQIFG